MPPLRFGVCTIRAPAPMPTVLGVPGTLIFALDAAAEAEALFFTASFASASSLAVLFDSGKRQRNFCQYVK